MFSDVSVSGLYLFPRLNSCMSRKKYHVACTINVLTSAVWITENCTYYLITALQYRVALLVLMPNRF